MSIFHGYRLVIIDSKAKNTRALSRDQVLRADLIIGRDNLVLKDRHGASGHSMLQATLDEIKGDATEVIER